MQVNKDFIKKLKNEADCSISEAKTALEKFNNDINKSLHFLKVKKTKDIMLKTQLNLEDAFILYKQFSGDTQKAINYFFYSHNLPNPDVDFTLTDYKNQFDKCVLVYDIFNLCPLYLDNNVSQILTTLYEFYSLIGELDNITDDEESNIKILEALNVIDCSTFIDLFKDYIDAAKFDDDEKINNIDQKLFESDDIFFSKLKHYVIKNLNLLYEIRLPENSK